MRLMPVAALIVVVAACGGGADETAGTGTVPVVSDRARDDSKPPLTAVPLPGGTAPGSVPPDVAAHPDVQGAVADLAARQGVSVDDVEVLVVREVTWRDGSLGCPQPGMNYTQALVDGQLVVLAIGGQRFEYHSGPNRPLSYCADPRPPLD